MRLRLMTRLLRRMRICLGRRRSMTSGFLSVYLRPVTVLYPELSLWECVLYPIRVGLSRGHNGSRFPILAFMTTVTANQKVYPRM
jgi:hypothetical protein